MSNVRENMHLYIKILAFLFTVVVSSAYPNSKFDDLIEIKMQELSRMDYRFVEIKKIGESNYTYFMKNYLSVYLKDSSRDIKESNLRDIISYYRNNPRSPLYSFEESVHLLNGFIRFNNQESFSLILQEPSKGENKLFNSMLYYSIGLLAEFKAGRSYYVNMSQEYNNLILKLVNNITPYFYTRGKGHFELKWMEWLFFQFYVTLSVDFPIDLTNSTLESSLVSSKDEFNKKNAKGTFYMELASYCLKQCSSAGNFPGNLNHYSNKSIISLILMNAYLSKTYQFNQNGYEFQDYIDLLLDDLELKKSPLVAEVKSMLALNNSKRSLRNIPLLFKTYQSNNSYFFKITFIFKKTISLLWEALFHFFIFLLFQLDFSKSVLFFSALILAFFGNNPIGIKEIFSADDSLKSVLRRKGYLDRVVGLSKIFSCFLCKFALIPKMLILRIYHNVISTYSQDNTSLIYKIAVQTGIVAITLMFSSLREFFIHYRG